MDDAHRVEMVDSGFAAQVDPAPFDLAEHEVHRARHGRRRHIALLDLEKLFEPVQTLDRGGVGQPVIVVESLDRFVERHFLFGGHGVGHMMILPRSGGQPSELQSLMTITYAVFYLQTTKKHNNNQQSLMHSKYTDIASTKTH